MSLLFDDINSSNSCRFVSVGSRILEFVEHIRPFLGWQIRPVHFVSQKKKKKINPDHIFVKSVLRKKKKIT